MVTSREELRSTTTRPSAHGCSTTFLARPAEHARDVDRQRDDRDPLADDECRRPILETEMMPPGTERNAAQRRVRGQKPIVRLRRLVQRHDIPTATVIVA